MKKVLTSYTFLFLVVACFVGVTVASFTDKAHVSSSSFTVGSSDIKFLDNLSGGIGAANLVDEKPGPVFNNIIPNWVHDYPIKLFNNSTQAVMLGTNAGYQTAHDPDELRQIIFVEPFEWDDLNNDGNLDDGELGLSLGRKTIVKWKTEGYSLGELGAGQVKSIILRFSTDTIGDSKQGTTGTFDFLFDSISI